MLARTELAESSRLFEFTLEALECAFNVITFFYWYNNHSFFITSFFLACKGRNFFSKKRLYSKIISNFAPLSVEGTISSIASLAG